MYIESINIERFGGIENLNFRMGDGVNIVEGANEAGKTTVAAFIRYMLYGFSDKAEREFYMGTLGVRGSMDIADSAGHVRIVREYGDGGESVTVYDLADNSVIAENCNPGEMLLGVPVNVYDRTAYVGQSMGATVDGGLAEAIENLLFAADENVNTSRSLKRLDDERVALRHKNGKGGRIFELTNERDELRERLKTAAETHASIFEKESALNRTREKIESNGALLAELEVKMRRCEDAVLARQYRELESLQLDCEDALEAYDDALADMTHDGFFPDRTYLANLKLVKSELEMLGEELDRTRSQADEEARIAGERTSYNFSPSAVLDDLGGEEHVTYELRTIHRKRTVCGIFGGMLMGLFIAALFFGVLTLMLNTTPGLALLCVGTGMLLGAILLFVRSSSHKAHEMEILDALGVSNISEYFEYLPIWRESAVRLENEAQNHGIAAEINAKTEAYLLKESELNLLAARWGSMSPDEIIDGVEQSLAELESLAAAHDIAEAKYEDAKRALGAYSPEELHERLENAPGESELQALGSANLRRDYDFAKNADKNMHEKLIVLERELAASRATVEHPAKIAERISEIEREISELTLKADALELAHSTLENAASKLRGSISPKLSEYAGNYLERLTDGRYASLNVASDLSMTYADGTGHLARKIDRMSAGTRDLAYISLRLALIRLLYLNIRPALIFDESFARLDDSRLALALGVLATAAHDGSQSIVFTSHSRDAAIMESLGEFDHVVL